MKLYLDETFFPLLLQPIMAVEMGAAMAVHPFGAVGDLLDWVLARKGARKLTVSDGQLVWGDGADESRAVVVVSFRDAVDGPVVDSLRVDANAASLIAALRAHRSARKAA